jgi:hypothetical protein
LPPQRLPAVPTVEELLGIHEGGEVLADDGGSGSDGSGSDDGEDDLAQLLADAEEQQSQELLQGEEGLMQRAEERRGVGAGGGGGAGQHPDDVGRFGNKSAAYRSCLHLPVGEGQCRMTLQEALAELIKVKLGGGMTDRATHDMLGFLHRLLPARNLMPPTYDQVIEGEVSGSAAHHICCWLAESCCAVTFVTCDVCDLC